MLTEAQQRAITKYHRRFMKNVVVHLNMRNEADKRIFEYLKTVDNKTKFIKALILQEMKKEQEELCGKKEQ